MDEANEVTVIKDTAWIVAWDGEQQRHTYLRNGDVAFRGGEIIHVGGRYDGDVTHEVDGRGLFVMPGLVDIHSHPTSQPLYKGIVEELGNPELWWSGLYDAKAVFTTDPEGEPHSAAVAYAEMLLSGVTTFVDLSHPFDGWVELMAASGARAYAAPMFGSAEWHSENGREVIYDWSADDGAADMAAAVAVVEAAEAHPCGRLGGMPSPATSDTCSPALLRDTMELCEARDWRFHMHISESVQEVQEIRRRHGVSPVRFLADLDLLRPRTILAHAIYIDTHSWVRWHTRDDLDLMASHGVSVAHCPTPFARYGAILESFGAYRRAGVNMAIGTDTTPHNMLDEMRWACVLAKAADGNLDATVTADVFEAATVGGARALGRDDIGRLAPGARADLVTVDLNHPSMRPARDPLRCLLFHAVERPIQAVYVDGQKVVDEGRVLGLDYESALAGLEAAQLRSEAGIAERHWSGRSAMDVAPPAIPMGD